MLTPPWSWVMYAVKWSVFSAMEPAAPIWQRVAGWALLVIFVALLLGITGMGVVFIGAGLGTMGSGGLIMVGFGALLFVFPAQAVRWCVRRKRMTGSLRVSREELGRMRAQSAAWRAAERQKPLGSKIVTTAVIVVLLSGWWLRVALRHAQHPHDDWFNPAMWTLVGIYLVWDQFRRPKDIQSQDSDQSVISTQ